MADSTASATWRGDLMSGSGQTSLASGAAGPMDVSWPRRTEGTGSGTSPEELIAAAHASCFSMALSHGLAQGGHAPTQLDTEATVTFAQADGGFAITNIALSVRGQVDGINEAAFKEAAEAAKDGCPVSKAFKGQVPMSVEATLA
jgi:osmotically inducible protein OsmC